MNKIALITGSTDGVGRGIALSLAKEGYTIHILGRSKEKGNKVLEEVSIINPKGKHRLYITDLSEINEVKIFLDKYVNENEKLDLLVLNANIAPEKVPVNSQGVDSIFMIGYISRYILTLGLENLLLKGDNSKIIHIGDTFYTKKVDFEIIKNPKYSILTATIHSYLASAYMAYFGTNLKISKISTSFFSPGVVLTKQVTDRGVFFTMIAKIMGGKQAEKVGNIFASSVDKLENKKFYRLGIEKKVKQVVKNGAENCRQMILESERLIGTLSVKSQL